ncbi:hypothetical protein CO669_23605 [Bradyrhizobium sp. Y36]|uniref:hypothetical protein n=1 Tax=Bradyrhizobium sp. Y36 TaxID=2035447 RepID=UPI000BE9B6D5|nr:hypothetical protein [Bradyrhizobium sp. Y36]PDT87856.1 hypothetical protein CO669_23605 [Bradyrhizobium sp. Y36]
MLSSLPKLADRNFIIGFFVPTLLAALIALWIFRDLDSPRLIYEAVWKEKKWEEITVFALSVWVFAMLLMLINHQLYRVAEGYAGPMAWIGNKRLSQRRKALIDEREELVKKEPDEPDLEARTLLSKRIDSIDQTLSSYYPHADFPVLPTRFGNAVRAFESYPPIVYGVDSIPTWIRLAALAPKQLVTAIADARAEVDFFLNTFVLSFILAFSALGRLALSIYGDRHFNEMQWSLLVCACGCGIISFLSYEGAIARAVAWGEHVKSAFDLVLPKLANTLGYCLPDTLDRQREFWTAFSLMALYSQPMDPSAFPRVLTSEGEGGGSESDSEDVKDSVEDDKKENG